MKREKICGGAFKYVWFNFLCIPESFNTIISQQLIDYKITFVNSKQENTNVKGDLNI